MTDSPAKSSSKFSHEALLEYLPLTPAVFHILASLSAGERHGYAIMKEVAEHTDGELRLGPGKLYYSIQRMLGEGLIQEVDLPSGQSPERGRRTYRLTDLGRALLEAEARRLDKALALVWGRPLLDGPQSAGDTTS